MRWFLMAVLAAVAVYFFLFANRGLPSPPVPADGSVSDPLLASNIQAQLAAIQQSPDSFDRRLQLCMMYEANALDELAGSCYQQVTELVPDHPRAWYQLAQVKLKDGDGAAAMEAMRNAVSRAGDVPFPDWQMGIMLLDASRPDEALGHLEAARAGLGNDPVLLSLIMQAQVDRGEPALAISLAQQHRLTESSIAPYVHQLLGQAYEILGETESAQQSMALAGGGRPAMADSWMQEVAGLQAGLPALKARINATMRAGKWTQALTMLDRLAVYEVPSRDVQLLKATCLAQSGAPEEAAYIVEPLLAESPDDMQLSLAMANIRLEIAARRKDLTQAEAALATAEAIIATSPENMAAHAVAMRALELLGRPNEAIAACRAAWRVNPQQPRALQLAAVLIAREELWKENEDLLRALWTGRPDHPAAGSMLVLSLVEQGRIDEARALLASLTSASLDGDFYSRAFQAVQSAASPAPASD